MNKKTLFKLCIFLICSVAVLAQEQTAQPSSNLAPQQQATASIPANQSQNAESAPAQKSSSNLDQNQKNEDQNTVSQKSGQPASNAEQNKTQTTVQNVETLPSLNQEQPSPVEVPPAADTQNAETQAIKSQDSSPPGPQAPTLQTQQASPQPQISPEAKSSTPQPQKPLPQIKKEGEIGGLQNLTEEQKAQLLHEENIRAQLHSNSSLNLADLANLTRDQLILLEQRFAEESRLSYQKAMKQLQQRETKEKQELQRLLREAKLSRTQEIRSKQRLKVRQVQLKQKNQNWLFNNFMFDMDPKTEEDFMISLPVAQQITFRSTIYSNRDGVYVVASDIDDEEPLVVQVLENNDRIVAQSAYYFEDSISFHGNADSTYTIKFQNSNKHRLIALMVTHVLEKTHIEKILTAQDVKTHSYRAEQLYGSLSRRFTRFDQNIMLQASNRKKLAEGIKSYYIYTVAEIVIFAALTLVQVQLIRKLLGSGSVI